VNDEPERWWADSEQAARRVLRGRIHNAARRDELVQETLTRVLAARPRLADDALVPYAIVTARNLAVTEHRRTRHGAFYDLGELSTDPGADEETLHIDEARALQVALSQLSDADRQLIVERDLEDRSIPELAARAGLTEGALRARLSRLRGQLRVAYVLAYRRLDRLPTQDCRPTLEALASGDEQKIRRARADQHAEGCRTCTELEPIVRHRKRWLAAIVGLFSVRRLLTGIRRHPITTSAAAAATAATTAVVVAASVPAPKPPVQAPVAQVVQPSESTNTATTAPPPQVLVRAAPWPDPRVAAAPGDAVAATGLTVVAVPSDELFVAHTNAGDEITTQLAGQGESPVQIQVGAAVTFTGVVTAPESTQPSGRRTVTVQVAYTDVRVSPPS
jgi:RNA polymerase sigma factor (sigma-70 family)